MTHFVLTLQAALLIMFDDLEPSLYVEVSVKSIVKTFLLSPNHSYHVYSGTSDKGPSEIGTTSLQRTLVVAPC